MVIGRRQGRGEQGEKEEWAIEKRGWINGRGRQGMEGRR